MIQRLVILILMACLFTGCTVSPANSNTARVQSTPSPTARASPVEAKINSVQVTLPLLDALLTDEKFVGELRNKIKLSNEQIDSVKEAAKAEIVRLRSSNAEDGDGDSDAGAARKRAADELRSILGDEKAGELASLANVYWSKGDQTARGESTAPEQEMLPGPNAVPSDTRIVVNIPAFRMDLFKDGSLIKSYQVGIGYPEFPLPQGLRQAQTIIFNPTWTPPDSPWVANIKNVTAGETVGAGDKLNPLGPIKIPIGLPSLIHGGKSPAKIGKFASHGCVGLTNAQIKDFAVLLGRVSDTDISDKTVTSYLQNRERTQTVKLSHVVPLELRYETIVVEDGKLHIYRDVYAQDTNTEANLRRVLEANGTSLSALSEQERTKVLDELNAMSNPKVARNQKEVVIEVSALTQKGYPAPVDLDNGSAKSAKQKKARNTNH